MKPHFNARALRKIGQLALLGCMVLMPARGFGQAPATPAPSAKPAQGITLVGYDRSIQKHHFDDLGKPTVLKMQQQLGVIYRDLADWKHDFSLRKQPLNDGVVGPVTLVWLQRYAFNFKFITGTNVGKDFPAHMDRMAAFAVAHPSDLAVLLDKQFEAWDAANATLARTEDFAVRRRADEAALIALVKRYRASLAPVSAPAAAPAGKASDGYHTYVLHAEDLAALGGKSELGAILGKFKDKPYASRETLKVALEQALKGRSQVLGKLWPEIEKTVRTYDGYLLNAANLAALKKEGMSASTLEELALFGTVYLKSPEAFETYVNQKIEAGELSITDDEFALLAAATKVFDNFHLDQQSLDTIENQLSGSVHYVGVPAAVIKMLEQIKEVDYPDASIFHSAARSKIAFGLGMCKLNTPVNNVYAASLAISNDEFASLQKELEALSSQTAGASQLAAHFDDITKLRNHDRRCEDDQKAKANAIVEWIYKNYLHAAVDFAGRKKLPDDIAPIEIKGGDCGCTLDKLTGVVYGFYPYWREQKQKQEPQETRQQTVNFRVLNRVAYYGLTMDNRGAFRLGGNEFNIQEGSANADEFIRTARRYNSKVDWLIQKNDWDREWSTMTSDQRTAVFGDMVKNISALLNAPLSSPAEKVESWITFGGSKAPRRGDGVTLYFANYPRDDAATTQFNEFYRKLRAEMLKHGLWLNILFTQETLRAGTNGGGGAFGLGNLIHLRKLRTKSENYGRPGEDKNDAYLLVLMNEPSADSKKTLRADVENDSTVHGAERADFLRSIVPVLHFDDRNWQQLDDDIVYARDNFGGVGLWAPDFDNLARRVEDAGLSCLHSQQIAVCLLKNYSSESVQESLPGPIELFACVHRWVLVWILLFLVMAGIVLTGLFFKYCKMQHFIKNHFLWVQLLIPLPALLVFVLLLLYHPLMLNLRTGNLPFFISAGIIMIGIGVGYWFWRAQRQVPQRERGIPQRQDAGFPIVVWKVESGKGGFQWLIKNRGTGYAIIKKVEILLDGKPMVDAKAALASVMASDNDVLWKSVALVGQKIEPGKQLVGLSIPHGEAARAFEQKLKAHELAVKITYSGPNNEYWTSDGSGITSISGVA